VPAHFDPGPAQSPGARLARPCGDPDPMNIAVGPPVQGIRTGFPGPTLTLQRASPGSGRVGPGFWRCLDFTLDYVTSAASLPNGTTIPLVQVPGSPEYKALMRHWLHMCEAVHNGTRSLDDIE
jgi:hypothetical protein